MNWTYLREEEIYKEILQEQKILSKFKQFPNIVNVNRVFIDDQFNVNKGVENWKYDKDKAIVG